MELDCIQGQNWLVATHVWLERSAKRPHNACTDEMAVPRTLLSYNVYIRGTRCPQSCKLTDRERPLIPQKELREHGLYNRVVTDQGDMRHARAPLRETRRLDRLGPMSLLATEDCTRPTSLE